MFNSKLNVNRIEWLDVVFANRNQSYGAYVLRRESGSYLKRAMLIAAGLFCGTVLLSAAYNRMEKPDSGKSLTPLIKKDSVQIVEVDLTKPEPPKPKQEKPKAAEPVSQEKVFNQVKYTPPRVVPDETPTLDIPTIEDISKSVIGSVDVKGEVGGENAAPAGKNNNNANGDGVGDETIYDSYSLQTYPQFPGGMDAWSKFLSKNLRYPSLAVENNITGRVTVSFVIETNGEITNLKVLRGIGAGCDEEAIRVIKKSPLWSPGIQNGRKVRVSYIMPIVFRLAN
jgi:protein TonB